MKLPSNLSLSDLLAFVIEMLTQALAAWIAGRETTESVGRPEMAGAGVDRPANAGGGDAGGPDEAARRASQANGVRWGRGIAGGAAGGGRAGDFAAPMAGDPVSGRSTREGGFGGLTSSFSRFIARGPFDRSTARIGMREDGRTDWNFFEISALASRVSACPNCYDVVIT